ATEVLAGQKDALTDAIIALGDFSRVADRVLTESGSDLRSLTADLKPILAALADAGKTLPETLSLLFTFPFPMETLFNAMRGDYTNLWDEVDLTGQRIQRSLLVGSPAQPWSDTGWAKTIADAGGAAGDPFNPRMPDPAAVEAPGAAPAQGQQPAPEPGQGAPQNAAPAPDAQAPGQADAGGAVPAPAAAPAAPGGGTTAGGAPGEGQAPAAEPKPVFDAPNEELFGPPATGEVK